MSPEPPDLEVRLARLQPAAPRPGLREDVVGAMRAAASPWRLDRVWPWALAASLLVGFVVASALREDAGGERRARIVAGHTKPISEDAKRWAAYARLLRREGLPNG